MARTAPVPNIPPIPGMCPSIAVMGGGGGAGGGGGKGGGSGDGSAGAGGEGSGADASGDEKTGGCAEGDPVCPITGRVLLQIFDFGFAGPDPLRWVRFYNSRGAGVGTELGPGWTHALGWRLEVRRTEVHVYDEQLRRQVFAKPSPGANTTNELGWSLAQRGEGFVLTASHRRLVFGPSCVGGVHHLCELSDRNGNRTTLERDADGRLLRFTDSAGRPYRVHTDPRGCIVAIDVATEASHQQWMEVIRYTYDEQGRLVGAVDAEGHAAAYAYAGRLLVEHRTVSGLSYFYVYDGLTPEAKCIETWGEYPGQVDPALEKPLPPSHRSARAPLPRGIHHRRFTYDPSSRYTEVETSLGGLVRYEGDERGRAVKIVDAAGGVTTRSFDPETGALSSESRPGGDSVRAVGGAVDAAAEVIQPNVADPRLRGRVREGLGEVLFDQYTGAIAHSAYDARGNLLEHRYPDGTRELWEYDERGLVRRHVARNGATMRTWHDPMGNLVRTDYGEGQTSFAEYDYLGRRVAYVDPSGRVTRWGYDRRSEIVWKQLPDDTEIRVSYDGNRRPLRYEHAGRVTRYEYGGMAWLTRTVLPGGETHERRYDTEGNPTLLRNARGQEFRIRYDRAGRTVEWTDFEGFRHRQSFGPDGQRRWIETPLGRFVIERNELGELRSLSTPGGSTVELEYDTVGPTKLQDGPVAVEVRHDVCGRVEWTRQGRTELSVGYLGGAVATVSGAASTLSYAFGRLGALSSLQVGGARRTFDDAEGEDLVDRLGDQLLLRRRYDRGGRLVRQSLERSMVQPDGAARPTVLSWTSYAYDDRGTLVRERRSDETEREYDVTPAGLVARARSIAAGRVLHDEELSYDAAGTVRLPGVRFDAAARPVACDNEALEYDVAGRLTRRKSDAGVVEYRYDDLGRLTHVSHPAGREVDMSYDARGRRLGKRVLESGVVRSSVRYAYAEHLLLHEIDEISGATRTYLRRMDRWETYGHVDRAPDGTEHHVYYVLGPNGAIDYAVDPSGRVVWSAPRALFGRVIEQSVEEVRVDLRFMNQFHDDDVGLTYNLFRWYDPRLGVFVTPDPAVIQGNPNPRDYAGNPLHEVDPTGLFTFTTGPAAGDADHHPEPAPNGPDDVGPRTTAPGQSIGRTAADAPALSGPGAWAVGSAGANGDSTPGFATCPPNLLDSEGPFGSETSATSPQGMVNRAGAAYGCHTCGSRNSGYSSNGGNHWTCDHIPPRSSFSGSGSPNGGAAGRAGSGPRARHESGATGAAGTTGAVRLFPQCRRCSDAQRNALSAESRGTGTASSSRALSQMRQNAGTPDTPL